MWYVKYLEMENFMSCKDSARINFGNFQDLKAVLGFNATGNPAIMDAMAFVLGLDSTNSTCLSDLIYKNPLENEAGLTTASVTLVCNNTCSVNTAVGRGNNIMTEKTFTGTILDSSYAVYQINGKPVTKKNYLEELQDLGLNAEDKYCLVLEAASVMLSTKSRKHRTGILFEAMSSEESFDLAKTYERLQTAIQAKDQELRQHLRINKPKYYLFKLFHWEKEKLELEKSVDEITEFNKKLKEDVNRKHGECRKKNKEFEKIEKEFRKMELNVRKLNENHVAVLARLKWQEEETNSAREHYENAEKEFSKHKLKTDELRKRIDDYEAQFLEIKYETKSEYDSLEVEAQKGLESFFQRLKDLQKKKIKIQLQLDSFNLQLNDFQTKLARTEEEFERKKKADRDGFVKTSDKLNFNCSQANVKEGSKRKRLEDEQSDNKRLGRNEEMLSTEKKSFNSLNKRAVSEIKNKMEKWNTEAKKVLNKTIIQHSEFTQFMYKLNEFEDKAINSVLQTIKKEEKWEANFLNLIKFLRDKIEETETLIESRREDLNAINGEYAEVEKSMNGIENEVFKDFCQSLNGVNNIKEFRVKEMIRENQQSAIKFELRNEIDNLKRQISYENRTNSKFEEMKLAEEILDFHENGLKVIICEESKRQEELDIRVGELDEVRNSRNIIKAEIDHLEDEIYEQILKSGNLDVKKELSKLRVGEIIVHRHQLLLKCKEQKIEIFLQSGDWSDVNYYSTNKQEKNKYAKEDELKFDFTSLEPNLDKVTSNKNIRNGDVNFKQFESIAGKVEKDWTSFERVLEDMKNLKLEFAKVKKQRLRQFMEIFKHVDSCVDKIYKELTKCGNASATLLLENVTEPYFDGVKYEFQVPRKRKAETSEVMIADGYVSTMALLMSILTFRNASVEQTTETNSWELHDQENIEKLADFIQTRNQRDRFRLSIDDDEEEENV